MTTYSLHVVLVFFASIFTFSAQSATEKRCEDISAELIGFVDVDGLEKDVTYSTRSLCVLKRARQNLDVRDCLVARELSTHCYEDIAVLKGDPKICDFALREKGNSSTRYEGKTNRRVCLQNYAYRKNSPGACKLLDKGAKECLDAFSRKPLTQREKEWLKTETWILNLPKPSPSPSLTPAVKGPID